MIFTKNVSKINFDELNNVLDNNNVDQNDKNSNSEIPAIKFLDGHIDPKLNFKHHIDARGGGESPVWCTCFLNMWHRSHFKRYHPEIFCVGSCIMYIYTTQYS